MRLRRVWLLVPLVVAVGCTRASWVGPIGTGTAATNEASPDAGVAIVAPDRGATVVRSIAVEARASAPAGTLVAAVLSVPRPDVGRLWLGSVPLGAGANGRYSGTLPFVVESRTVAELEVVISRMDDGSVVARDAVSITLQPAP